MLDEVDQVAVKMLPSDQFSKSQLHAFFNEVQVMHSSLCWTDNDTCGFLSRLPASDGAAEGMLTLLLLCEHP